MMCNLDNNEKEIRGNNEMDLSGEPFISVVIATCNRSSSLSKCLKGILANQYRHYEIIIIDQSHNNKTMELINEEFSINEKIGYFRSEIIGLSHARNLGINNAKGEIIVFIDDDAEPVQGWLGAYARVFTDVKPTPAMAGGRIEPLWETRRPNWYPAEREFLLGVYDIGGGIRPFPGEDLPIGANFAVLRWAVERLGGFDERLGFDMKRKHSMMAGEDSLMAIRMKEVGYAIYYQPEAKVYHHISGGKLTRKYFLKRHVWEGMTHIAIEKYKGSITVQRLMDVLGWHSKKLWETGIEMVGDFLFARGDGSSKTMLKYSKLAYSLGVCIESLHLLLEEKLSGLGWE